MRENNNNTYIVEMSFHVNKSEGLLQKGDEEPRRDSVVVELVLVHVRLLSKHKSRVLKTYTIY